MLMAYMCDVCGCSRRFRVINQDSTGSDSKLVRQAPIERFIEPCILLMLSKKSSYGYELMKNLEEQCGETIDVGNLYRTLRRMEEDGWVISDWEKGENGPKKRIYTITPDGEGFLHSAALGLEKSQAQIGLFLNRYKEVFKEEGGETL